MPHKQQSERYSYRGELVSPFETEKAYHFSPDEYGGVFWLPKSQVDWQPDRGEATGQGGTMFIPEWLAQKLDILP